MIISRFILLRVRNLSHESFRGNQSTVFRCNKVFGKSFRLWECGKLW